MKKNAFKQEVRRVVEEGTIALVEQQVKAVTGVSTDPQYVDDRDLATRTPLSRVTWQTLRSRGKGPPYYKVGKRCLYRWSEVLQWLESTGPSRRQVDSGLDLARQRWMRRCVAWLGWARGLVTEGEP